MDGTIERHWIGAFHLETGAPLLREEIGFQDDYRLDQCSLNSEPPIQLRPFSTAPIAHKLSDWRRIDAAHLIRAYSHAVAAYAAKQDPAARMWLICQAHDVIRSYCLRPIHEPPYADGYDRLSLYKLKTNVWANPHLAKIGIVRWLAWSLRAVVEAQRVAPSRLFSAWIQEFVDLLLLAQAENGALADEVSSDSLNQDEPYQLGLDRRLGVCTPWQHSFMVSALRKAVDVLPTLREPVRVIFARMAPMFRDVPYVADMYGGVPGPNRYVVTSKDGELLPKITTGIAPARTENQADTFRCFEEMGV
jgi:hypothetical protein